MSIFASVKNFKKYILLFLATLFLSVPSFAEKNVFFGEGKELVQGAGKVLTSKPSWLPNRIISGNTSNPKGLLGVYDKTLPNGSKIQDTKNMLDELVFPEATASNFKTVSKDGFKMLNTPKSFYQNADQFWTQYNKPWLDDLVANKADVVILSDKSDDLLKYVLNSDGTFKIENGQRVLTGFGREIQYMDNLVQQGKYQWNALEGLYKHVGN
jgi:hypothetical protein